MTEVLQDVQLLQGRLSLSLTDDGEGKAIIIIHGGAGPASVAGLARALEEDHRVIVPTLPGFNGTERPDWLSSIKDLAVLFLNLIESLNLSEVVVVGNSVGGWIAAEVALSNSTVVKGIVLLNAVGIDAGSGKSILDPTKYAPAERARLAFHDPAAFAVIPHAPEGLAIFANNQRTLQIYAGDPFMHDPSLRYRLAGIHLPVLVIWGTSDRIVDADYGARFAGSIPGARFLPMLGAGHFPQIEKPLAVKSAIEDFCAQAMPNDSNS